MQAKQLRIIIVALAIFLGISVEHLSKRAVAQSVDQSVDQLVDHSLDPSINPQANQSANLTNESDLVCYMQTAEGALLDLTSMCGMQRRVANSQPASIISISPVSNLGGLSTLQNPDGTPCFGLDAQGRPCATAR